MLQPYNVHHDNIKPLTTTCAEPARILPDDRLFPEDHRQHRQMEPSSSGHHSSDLIFKMQPKLTHVIFKDHHLGIFGI